MSKLKYPAPWFRAVFAHLLIASQDPREPSNSVVTGGFLFPGLERDSVVPQP